MTAPSPGRVTVLARAKVNLYLHVLGRRADGYHLLDSLVVFADVGDRIEVAAAESLLLAVDGPFAGEVPAGDDNLVLQAARALMDAAGQPRAGAAIRLTKSLPVASGIGGGSADAAATLRALVRLWRVDIDGERLRRLALALGADVPMCLGAGPAFVGGIGERIDPALDLPACALLLVNPRAMLPTPQVFARRRGPFSQPGRFMAPPADARALAASLADRRNDLIEAAIGLMPAVALVLDALRATPGVLLARMSGSGATCFGLCEEEAAASAAARALAERHPHWWITAAAVAGRDATD